MKKAYFTGIGGIGMSALALLAKNSGFSVSGSDLSDSAITDAVIKKGIKVNIGQVGKNIHPKTDILVYSLAVEPTNPERAEASKLKIKQMSYPEALGWFTKKQKNICISGTHGKSTVSGMLSKILVDCKVDPLVIIGTKTKYLKSGGRFIVPLPQPRVIRAEEIDDTKPGHVLQGARSE